MTMEICSKVLSKIDIKERLSVPTRRLRDLPRFPNRKNFQVLNVEDEEGEMWSFRLIKRKRGRYSKPVLSANWRRFVMRKNLQKGFKVEFFKETNEVTGEVKYKIKLKKPVVLFNKVIGYEPLRQP